MSEPQTFRIVLVVWLALAAAAFLLLLFVPAPYGRYTRKSFGPTVDRRLGWILMELPSPVIFALCFALGPRHGILPLVWLLLWLGHYGHRAVVFPFQMRGGAQQMNLAAALLGLFFNFANAYLNGRYLFALGPERGATWLLEPRFVAGVTLFAAGFIINRRADLALQRLRGPGESGYKIPRGGLFEIVSCPNYLGEIIEWCGWALCTWSLPGLGFALWTAANLVPRAISHHRWYRTTFTEYPRRRRALVPFLL